MPPPENKKERMRNMQFFLNNLRPTNKSELIYVPVRKTEKNIGEQTQLSSDTTTEYYLATDISEALIRWIKEGDDITVKGSFFYEDVTFDNTPYLK